MSASGAKLSIRKCRFL